MSNHQQFIDGIKYGQVNEIDADEIEPDEPTTGQSLDAPAAQDDEFLDVLHDIVFSLDAYMRRGRNEGKGVKARWLVITHLLGIDDSNLTQIGKQSGVTQQTVSHAVKDARESFGLRSPHSRKRRRKASVY